MSAKLCIGVWDVDPAACVIRHGDTSTKLTPRSMSVLEHLAERAGEVVSGETLLSLLWPRTVNSPNAVYKVITELREALRDDPTESARVETVPKRGYRLVAKVEIVGDQGHAEPVAATLSNGSSGDRVTSAVAAPQRLNGTENGAVERTADPPAVGSATEAGEGLTNGQARTAQANGSGGDRPIAVPRKRATARRGVAIVVALALVSICAVALWRTAPIDRADFVDAAQKRIRIAVWQPLTLWVFNATGRCVGNCDAPATTLAILPLRNLGTDPADAYLGDGIATALVEGIERIQGRARSKQISLIHPGAAVRELRSGRSAADIATALGAAHLLSGTIQHEGDRLRVSIEVTRAADRIVLYSERFDAPVDRFFELQDDLVEGVGNALSVHLDPFRRAKMIAGGTTNAKAYLALQEAEYYFRRTTLEDAARGREAADRALALDPQYVDAYWCLIANGSAASSRGLMTGVITREQYAEAVQNIRRIGVRAGKEVPESGVERAAMIEVSSLTGDRVGLEASLRDLIRRPDSAVRRHIWPEGWYAAALERAGLFDESKAYRWLAYERKHESPEWLWESSIITLQREGPAAVIPLWKLGVDANAEDLNALSGLIDLLAREGQFDEAGRYLEKLAAVDRGGNWTLATRAMIDVYRGTLRAGSSELRDYLADPRAGLVGSGYILFMLGDVEGGIQRWQSLDALDRDFVSRSRLYIEYHLPPAVVVDPRYQALLDRLGMGAQWRGHLEAAVRELEPFTGIGLAADHPGRKPPGEWRWKL